jgi:hypothetical protein
MTVKLVDALQVEPDDIVHDLACGRELSVEISNRRLSGFSALVGVDILRMALSIARLWIYVLTNHHQQ